MVTIYHWRENKETELKALTMKATKLHGDAENLKINKYFKNDVEVEISKQLFILNEFIDNSYIGEIEIFNKKRRQHYAIANKDTHLMFLSKTDLESILKDEYPLIYSELKRISDKRLEQDMIKIKEIDNIASAVERRRPVDITKDDASESSIILEKEEEAYKNITLENLYDRATYPFGIEEIIGEQATEVKDIPFEETFDNKELPLDRLAEQLEGRMM